MRLVLINFFVWMFFHLSISLGLIKLPDRYLMSGHPLNSLFKERAFEKNGRFWRQVFKVHRWKDKLPDGASLFNAGYKKKALQNNDVVTMGTFIKETKRAELTHWLLMVPAPFFFLWNPYWAGWVMVMYALLANVPFILIQRYNRIRLTRIRAKKSKTY